MKPASQITYHFWKSIEPWSKEEGEACQFASKHGKVLQVSNTPKHIGQVNVQLLYYVPGQSEPLNYKHFKGFHGWNKLVSEAVEWMNNHLYPNQPVSLSLFEEDHPNEDNEINISVFFTGVEHATVTLKPEIPTPVFRAELIENCNTWEELFESVSKEITKQGGTQSRFLVDCCNNTEGDSNVGVVVHWTKIAEEAVVEDTSRGDCCTIF